MDNFIPLHRFPRHLPWPKISPGTSVRHLPDDLIDEYKNKEATRFLKTSSGWGPKEMIEQMTRGLNRLPNQPAMFRHRPLNDDIRLFVLHSGDGSAQIKGHLMHVSPANRVRYEALSYTWGPPADSKSILLNDGLLPVTDNLYCALLHLRLPSSPRYLWIDAICINQKDNVEKSVQIQRMTSIYQLASQVLIWLGPSQHDSDLAMDVINGRDIFNIPGEDREPRAFNLGNVIAVVEGSPTEKESIAVFRLLNQPWWTRVWCLQEVAVANSDPVILCGHKSVPWSAYTTISAKKLEIGVRMDWRTQLCLQEFERRRDFVNARDQFQKKHSTMSLSFLLRNAMTMRSTDPRDKVYALLGIAREEDRQALIPDYDRPVDQVLIDTMTYVMLNEGGPNILSFVKSPNSLLEKQSATLPSWVSSWTWKAHRPPLWNEGLYNTSKGFNAPVSFLEDGKVLCIKGLHFDTVDHISAVIRGPGARDGDSAVGVFSQIIENLGRWLDDVSEERRSSICPTSTGNPHRQKWKPSSLNESLANSDAFWRTLIADRYVTIDDRHATPAPPFCSELFEIARRGRELMRDERIGRLIPLFERAKTEVPNMQNPLFLSLSPEDAVSWIVSPLMSEMSILPGRRLFVTRNAHLGLAGKAVQEGDLVTILAGGDVPFLLRAREGGEQRPYDVQLVGEAYVHGVMYGEAIESWEKDGKEPMVDFRVY
jgi:Heterokaryon incompatibility protein (HET)